MKTNTIIMQYTGEVNYKGKDYKINVESFDEPFKVGPSRSFYTRVIVTRGNETVTRVNYHPNKPNENVVKELVDIFTNHISEFINETN